MLNIHLIVLKVPKLLHKTKQKKGKKNPQPCLQPKAIQIFTLLRMCRLVYINCFCTSTVYGRDERFTQKSYLIITGDYWRSALCVYCSIYWHGFILTLCRKDCSTRFYQNLVKKKTWYLFVSCYFTLPVKTGQETK